jgi:hypothetical protein
MRLMSESYYVGSYWPPRPEPAEACARRMEEFFRLLGRCEPTWIHWYETANSFEEARKRQVRTDAANLTRLLEKKENRIGDGFFYGLWAGDAPKESTGLNGGCGSASPWSHSNCVLTPPSKGTISERVLTAPVMAEALRAMALAWEPEYGIASSDQHRRLITPPEEFPHPGNFVGWMMYFSQARGAVPPLPAPVRVEPVEDKGTLLLLTPERFTASNPEHVELAAHVHAVLAEAGLLRPVYPVPSQG